MANDSKYGYDTANGQVRMTVLRSAIYADHYGKRDEFCEYMEQGIHEFSYSIYPYESNSDAERKASELNFGLVYLMESFHNGVLPEKFCGIECTCDNTIVSCIKQKYDSDDTVVRLYEIDGRNTDLTLKIFEKEMKKRISANGLMTFTEEGDDLNLFEL